MVEGRNLRNVAPKEVQTGDSGETGPEIPGKSPDPNLGRV
jgi:hypothetical protein